MSADPTAPNLAGLLARIQDLGLKPTRAALNAVFREPQSADLEEAHRRAALVRTLDEHTFSFLVGRGNGAAGPTLKNFLAAFASDFTPMPPDGWLMRENIRNGLLADWQEDNEREWRAWNSDLQNFFANRAGKSNEVEAVYHAAGSAVPAAAIPYIDGRYKAADDRADFAQCHALLESLRVQKLRGTELSVFYRDKSRYLQTRLMFLEALQKTGSYVKRDAPHLALQTVLSRQTADPWIFHIHATGGYGKTMLLRWFVARDLVLRRVPCATVDFDDPRMLSSLQYPLRFIKAILGQWAQQMTQTALTGAVSLLESADTKTGWDENTLATLRIQLEGASIHEEMVAVLDTLEERTLFQADWVRHCLDTLRELHGYLPRLTVILAGRYDLARITSIFQPGEAITHDLQAFSETEATAYLDGRGITGEKMKKAIVGRALVDQLLPETAVTETVGAPPAFNPFKLSMLVDLVLADPSLQAEDVEQLPSAEIAYLIERVILRIAAQPLRWVVRYGAIARELTLPFIEEVLLPPLKDALRGDPGDLSTRQPNPRVQSYLDSKVTWRREPEVAAALTALGLWNDLKTYARERGWISQGDTVDVLHLHPEVIQPVQMLLSSEPVYRTLHTSARDFYLKRWASSEPGPAADLSLCAREAIYHATTLDRTEGEKLWQGMIENAPARFRYAIATEPTRKSYLDENDRPKYPDWYCRAHIESARLVMHAAGIEFSATSPRQATFAAHVLAAMRQDPAAVPPLFTMLVGVEDPSLSIAQGGVQPTASGSSNSQKAAALVAALSSFAKPYELLWLSVRAAHYWTADRRFEEAVASWRMAADSADAAGVAELTRGHADYGLAEACAQQGHYSDAMAAYERVRRADVFPIDVVLQRQAKLALDVHDFVRSQTLLSELTPRSTGVDVTVLELRQFLAVGDTKNFFQKVEILGQSSDSNERLAIQYSLRGEAHRLLMDYGQSIEMFSRATDLGTAVERDRLLSPPGLREIEIYAFEVGNLDLAQQLLNKVTDVSSAHDQPDLQIFSLMRAYLSARSANQMDAARLVQELSRDISPRVRARALLLGAAFDLFEDAGIRLAALLDSIDALDPAELMSEVFAILEYIPSMATGRQPLYQPIRDRVLKRFEGRNVPVEIQLQMLDLARVCGADPADVARQLQSTAAALPNTPSALRLRYGVRVLDHHGRLGISAPFRYENLLAESTAAGADGSPLQALLKSRASTELAASGNIEAALQLADDAISVWRSQPSGGVLAELTATRERLAVSRRDAPSPKSVDDLPTATLEHFTPGPTRSIPDESLPPSASSSPRSDAAPTPGQTDRVREMRGLVQITVDPQTASNLEKSLDTLTSSSLTTRIFRDWVSVQNLMVATVRDLSRGPLSPVLQLVTPTQHAALPWEFAIPVLGSRLLCRGLPPDRALRDVPLPSGSPVLLIKPQEADYADQRSFSISEEASSGFSLEHLYAEGQANGYVTTLNTFEPDQLSGALLQLRPQIIHIVGQVLESTAGVYFDLEGAERRLTRSSRGPGQQFDAPRLFRYFGASTIRPIVILDITAPENVTDAVRMLLLRNRFAAELFQSGAVRAVLATGLTAPDERESFSRALVSGIHQNTSLAFLWNSVRDDDEPQNLGELIGHCSSALFAYNPYARVLDPTTARARA